MSRFAARVLAALALFAGLVGASPAAFAQGDGPYVFEIEALNEGLGPPPEGLDRSTPRASLEAFLSRIDRERYGEAAHLLDLAPVPAAAQADKAPELARKLGYILRRKLAVSFEGLPDRRDGMETLGSDRNPMVGETRRSLALGELDLAAWPVTVRLNRVAPAGGDPVWVFSRQTVEHIDALYDAFGPTALEQMLPEAMRAEAPWWGLLWWELVAIPLIGVVAVAIGVLLWRVLTLVADRVTNKGVRLGAQRMRLPLVLLVVGIVLHLVVTNLFMFSAATDTMVSTLFWILIVVAAVYGASRILDTIIDAASDRMLSAIDDPQNTRARHWYTNLSAAKRLGVIVVLVVALAWALAALELFDNFGLSLLVAAGAATAIFGLAAQTVLGNILSSLQISLAKPIRIGDAVYFEDHWAYVERINWTFVQLRTWDEKRYIVPVRKFVGESFQNWTKEDPTLIIPVVLTLDHRADVEAIRRAFHEMAVADPDWAEGSTPKVQVIGQDEDGIKVRFYCTADNPTAAWNLHCRMRERLIALLRQEDEPSDLPRVRLAYVENTLEADASAPTSYEDGYVEETGEAKGRPLPGRDAAE